MKTVFVHDEIIPGFNDARAEVIPAASSIQPRDAAALFKLLCAGVRASKPVAVKDDSLSRLDRAIADLGRRQARDAALREQQEARRNMGVGSFPGAPSADELAAQWRRDYAAKEAQLCAEAKAAYDARNPHKRKEGAK